MDAPLLHPYALFRRGLAASASALALGGPRQSIFDDWESPRPSMGSEYGSEAEFATLALPPFDKPDIPSVQSKGYPYVKHDSGITLLLSGHKAGKSIPVYQSGSLISGMVVLAKPAGVASLDVKLEGVTSVREIQGGGRSSIVFYSDQLITWEAAGANLPDELSFRRIVPIFSHDGRLLPPSFDSRLSAIPGFRVSVKWSIVVRITRTRMSPLSIFRRTARLAVPIGYVPRTRPPMSGPFPVSSTYLSPSQPRTSFVDLVPARKEHIIPIHTQIYLPHSQITPMTEVIPFRVVLSAPEAYLKPFLALPSQSSFLPLGSAASPVLEPASRPVTVQLVRRIGADPRETFVVVVGDLATSAMRGSILAEGLLSQPELGQDSVSWWGQLCVPLGLASPGGFVADRLVVQDALVLTLNVPGMHTHVSPFRQVVPIRLTTDSPGTSDALQVTGV